MWLGLLWGCGGGGGPAPSDANALVAALSVLPDDPEEGFRRCVLLRDDLVRADCVTAVVEAVPTHGAAGEWCAVLESPWRDECGFARAEHADDPALCDDAGIWAPECKLHVWRNRVKNYAHDQMSLEGTLAAYERRMRETGLDPGIDLYWLPVFMYLLDGGAIVECSEAKLNDPQQQACDKIVAEIRARDGAGIRPW